MGFCTITLNTLDLSGEYNDNDFIVTRGDSRIFMTIAKDKYSIQLNRENRFIIDDYNTNDVLAYRLTKPFKLGGTYNGTGVLNFVLYECNTEDTDNLDLHIANYYDHFARDGSGVKPAAATTAETPDGKKVWF